MDLHDYVRLIRRGWLSIVAMALLGVLVSSAATLVLTPTYKATTQLFVAIQGTGTVSELQQGNTFTQARVESYVRTATTPAVLQPVIDSLGLGITPSELSERITAAADPQTVLIRLSADSTSPVEAAAIAQAAADSLIQVVEDLERPVDGGPSPVRLSVITPASAPSDSSSPNPFIVLAGGLVVGMILGFFVALLRSVLDTKVRGEADVAGVMAVPMLGGITYDTETAKSPLVTQVRQQSPRAESFRQIRTNLKFATVGSQSKAILVTSSLPGEGKSTTATNMAIAMAQAGQRVVLVDADLRRPMIANYLGLEGSAGLTTALVGTAHIDDLLQPWGDDELYVLSSGQIPPNPSELLGSAAMSQLIEHLESQFDAVIIDAPPLIPVTDATVLTQRVGGVVLVVGSGKIKTQDLEKSSSSLELVNANVLGVVLNLLPTKGPDAYAYTYYSYESKPELVRDNRGRRTRIVSNAPSEDGQKGHESSVEVENVIR